MASPSLLPLDTLHTLLRPVTLTPADPRSRFINWGLSFECTPLAVFEPETEYQCELILELARRQGKTVRAAGVGHSPSDLACTTEFMLRTEKLNKIIEINADKNYVLAQGGVTLNDLHAALAQHNLAMLNVGSISDQTLAGVVTTATHGTGMDFKVISTHVLSLTLLLADGHKVRCSRQDHPDLFTASLCSLGSTGLILQIQLEVGPAFRLKETQECLPFDDVARNLDTISRASEHVRLWWFPQADTVRVSSADRTNEPRKPYATFLWHSLVGFHLVQLLLFFGRYLPSINPYICQFCVWLDRAKAVAVDDSWRVFNIDCKYPQYTTEWAIPYEQTSSCIQELRQWLQQEHDDPNGLRPHFPVEVRFSDTDDVWLSPSFGRKTTWIGIVQYKPYGLNMPYRKLFERFEQILARHEGRPHWAKSHPLRPDDLRKLYPRFDDFVRVLNEVDPRGIFRNEYVQRHIFDKPDVAFEERIFKRLR
ncbi:D-arabinono-1,4-lactone oxidase-domain-containing protein [Cytidiella melzeri]|nr:D-arabinono-1,4-lactone oxidase-domain-containing protein [Cytidiella melzeri]